MTVQEDMRSSISHKEIIDVSDTETKMRGQQMINKDLRVR